MTPQDIIDLRDHIAAFVALQKGAFEVEIERITAINSSIEQRLGIVKTMEQAASITAQAEDYATRTRAEADRIKLDAQTLAEKSAALDISSRAKDASLRAKETELSAREDSLDKAQRDFQAAQDAAHVDHLNKQAAHEVKANSLADREAAVTARETEVDRKVNTIRALV